MRVLITGARGQLGAEIARCFACGTSWLGALPDAYRAAEVVALGHDELDIADYERVRAFFEAEAPFDVIFNCAAATNVDACEYDEGYAQAGNVHGPRNLALGCAQTGAKLVHFSTDYVFDGEADRAYVECDEPNPVNAYGRTKLAGEREVLAHCPDALVMRTSWLYGAAGGNFVKTMARLGRERDRADVVCDQVGCLTHAGDVAGAALQAACMKTAGILHCSNAGAASWADVAERVFALTGSACAVRRVTTEEYVAASQRPVLRPHMSALDCTRLREECGIEMRGWETALAQFVRETAL